MQNCLVVAIEEKNAQIALQNQNTNHVEDLYGSAVLPALQVNSVEACILSMNKENTLKLENINYIVLKSVLCCRLKTLELVKRLNLIPG